jgi:hypothetical protein
LDTTLPFDFLAGTKVPDATMFCQAALSVNAFRAGSITKAVAEVREFSAGTADSD